MWTTFYSKFTWPLPFHKFKNVMIKWLSKSFHQSIFHETISAWFLHRDFWFVTQKWGMLATDMFINVASSPYFVLSPPFSYFLNISLGLSQHDLFNVAFDLLQNIWGILAIEMFMNIVSTHHFVVSPLFHHFFEYLISRITSGLSNCLHATHIHTTGRSGPGHRMHGLEGCSVCAREFWSHCGHFKNLCNLDYLRVSNSGGLWYSLGKGGARSN